MKEKLRKELFNIKLEIAVIERSINECKNSTALKAYKEKLVILKEEQTRIRKTLARYLFEQKQKEKGKTF